MLFTVDPELCKKDGLCVIACGRRLIEMKDSDTLPAPVAEADALCINCGHCVAVCPAEAFTHRDISDYLKEELDKRIKEIKNK